MVRTDNLFRKYEFASPVALAAGRFDAGFLMVLILPLFMLALGHNVVAEERESGRLRLAQMQGKSTGKRLFARLLLRQAPAYAVIALLAIWALATLGPSARLAMWLAASLAYLLFWTGVSALVAASPRRPERRCGSVSSSSCRREPRSFRVSSPRPHRSLR
jgi:ABC-2 type transport system permease protein